VCFDSTNPKVQARRARHAERDLEWRIRAALRRVRPTTAARWRVKLRAMDAAVDVLEGAEGDEAQMAASVACMEAWDALPQPIRRAIDGSFTYRNYEP
jgi:hypothetical protein